MSRASTDDVPYRKVFPEAPGNAQTGQSSLKVLMANTAFGSKKSRMQTLKTNRVVKRAILNLKALPCFHKGSLCDA